MSGRVVNVAELIDARPIGRLQWLVFVLCGAAVFVEGFDAQAIGYVAPVLGKALGLRPGGLGPVFASGLAGLALGAFFLAPLADRWGRRPVILWSTLCFGLMTVATGLCTTFEQLLVVRVLTGFGLGAALPNAISLTAEYSPGRSRVTVGTLQMCGFGLGAAAGGFVAARLLESAGWPTVFYVGGAVTLVLVPLLWAFLPESLRFLAVSTQRDRLPAMVRRLDPSLPAGELQFVTPPGHGGTQRVRVLFADGLGRSTVLLWIVFFMGLLDLYLLANWLPTAIHASGLSLGIAAVATTMLQFGGIVASFAIGPLVDRFGAPRVLPAIYVFGAACIAAIGFAGVSVPMLIATVFGAGFAIVGGQNCNNAVAAALYPTQARATGVGWALGIGRIGSIVGPTIGGIMIGLDFSVTSIMLASAVPALIAAAAYLGMRPTGPRHSTLTSPSPAGGRGKG